MTEQEIIKGNKLIHEFISPLSYTDGKKSMNNNYLKTKKLKYHSSWDWLMPVVEKIEGIYPFFTKYSSSFSVVISDKECYIEYSGYEAGTLIETIQGNSKKEATWLAVVEFIKWYNEENKNE